MNSRWPLSMCHCFTKEVHVAREVSSILDEILIQWVSKNFHLWLWICFYTNPWGGAGHSRWGVGAGAVKDLQSGINTIDIIQKRILWDIWSGLCATKSFRPTISTTFPTAFKTPRLRRWRRRLRVHIYRKSGQGGSVRCTWALCCLWTARECVWI